MPHVLNLPHPLLPLPPNPKIFLYHYGVSPEILRTLRHYRDLGTVDLTEWSMSGHNPGSDTPLHQLAWLKLFYLQGRISGGREGRRGGGEGDNRL